MAGAQGRLEALLAGLLALVRGIEAVRNQVEEHPGDFLRIQVDHAGVGIEVALERDVEAGFFGPRAVIGEIEAFLDDRVDVGGPVLARSLARMQQHVLDDRIGALAVLHHLFEIALQHMGELVDLLARLVVERGRLEHVVQFVDQFRRQRREIVDEIERVLDLMGDAGGELAERSQLLGLHQAVLRGAQIVERQRQLLGALLHLVRTAARSRSRSRPGRQRSGPDRSGAGVNGPGSDLPSSSTPSTAPSRISGTASTARYSPSTGAGPKLYSGSCLHVRNVGGLAVHEDPAR